MNYELAFYILAGYVVIVWLATFFAKTWERQSILFSYSNPLLVIQKCYREAEWKIKMRIKKFKERERKVKIKEKHIIEKEYRIIIDNEFSNPHFFISYKLNIRKVEPKLINMGNIVPLVFIREDLKDDMEMLEKADKIFKIVKYAKKEFDILELCDLIIKDKNTFGSPSNSPKDKTANYIEVEYNTFQKAKTKKFVKKIEEKEEERVRKLRGSVNDRM